MRNKTIATFLLLIVMIIGIGCQKNPASQEQNQLAKYQKSYVVSETNSLPYFESQQKFNSTPVDELLSQLALYDNDVEELYILVDNEGNEIIDEEFSRDKTRDFSEEQAIVDKIKNYPLFIVKKDSFYVTTAEKEIDALFDGKRDIFNQENLEEILSDNEDAYKKKDYEAILDYLMKKEIKVWNPPNR